MKFITSDTDSPLLGAALLYLYDKYHGKSISSDCNYSYNAKGTRIPREDIKNWQFFD